MYCRGEATGISYYGYSFRVQNQGVVYPGQRFEVFVKANDPYNDPIQYVDGWIDCRI